MKANVSRGYALVTGASSGIGKAIALDFARRGYDLLLTALPDSGLQAVRQELVRFPVAVHLYEANLTSPVERRRLFDWCVKNDFHIMGLVNNAGIGSLGAFEGSDIDNIFEMINLNITAVTHLTWLFIPLLKRSPVSYLLNVSSIASDISIPNKAVYAATKAFIKRFSHSLRVELAGTGISVCCLCPGGTLTGPGAMARISQSGVSPALFCKPAQFVARCAVTGLLRGKATIVPGLVNRLILTVRYFVPDAIEARILKLVFQVSCKRIASPAPVMPKQEYMRSEDCRSRFERSSLFTGSVYVTKDRHV